MVASPRSPDTETESTGDADDPERVRVSTHRTNPDRTVFIEEDNPDGWIATSLTVALDQ